MSRPTTWAWEQVHALPAGQYDGAIHCVTAWSKFGMRFAGVSVDTLLAEAGPAANAAYVLARPYTGYTTNLPLDDATGGKAWVAWDVTAARCATSTAVAAARLQPRRGPFQVRAIRMAMSSAGLEASVVSRRSVASPTGSPLISVRRPARRAMPVPRSAVRLSMSPSV